MNGSPVGRVVEIAEDCRYLAKDRGFLTVAERGTELGRVPLDDISAVLATALGTSVSCALLAELAGRGIPFVVCGRNYAPAGLLWPLEGHHAQQRRMEMQLAVKKPLQKQLWALIVSAKILAQGAALQTVGRPSSEFAPWARRVKSGDTENLEAQAARRYWPRLMGREFRRDTEAPGANALLNYGYAVLRGSAARAIAAAGLHPGLGIFHRHPNNAMPLADDLMEPFRPQVDLRVVDLLTRGETQVTPAAKRCLAGVLHATLHSALGTSPLETCLLRLATSLADSFVSGKPALELPLPDRLPSGDDDDGAPV